MKYMFIVNHYYPYSNSGGNVIRRIVEYLALKDEVIVYSLSDNADSLDEIKYELINGVKVIRGSKTKLRFISHAAWRVKSTFEHHQINVGYYKTNCREIQKIVNNESVDIVYGVCFPFASIYCVEQIKGDLEKRALYLDPYYSNQQYDKTKVQRRKKEETEVLKQFSRMYITSALEHEYTRSIFDGQIMVYNLPNVEDKREKTRIVDLFDDDNEARFLYIGTLYHDIRTPNYLFNVWKYISKKPINGKMPKLYMVGNNDGLFSIDYFQKWKEELGASVKFCNRVSEEEANFLCFKADYLISIGNTVDNQIPGKTIDYLCFGKPIIHFSESPNDLSVPVFKKYPSYLSLYGKNYRKDEADLYEFAIKHQDINIEFSEIKKIYCEYTIEAVGDALR